jgi:hypothetical protein
MLKRFKSQVKQTEWWVPMLRNLRPKSLVTILCLAGMGIAAGCGKSDVPKTVPVEGVVTYQGKPVAGAYILFMGQGPLAHGETDDQGHYKLMTTVPGDGAPPGNYKVTISKSKPGPGSPPGNSDSVEWINELPERYADVELSLLTAAVEAGKKNEFKFDLED